MDFQLTRRNNLFYLHIQLRVTLFYLIELETIRATRVNLTFCAQSQNKVLFFYQQDILAMALYLHEYAFGHLIRDYYRTVRRRIYKRWIFHDEANINFTCVGLLCDGVKPQKARQQHSANSDAPITNLHPLKNLIDRKRPPREPFYTAVLKYFRTANILRQVDFTYTIL